MNPEPLEEPKTIPVRQLTHRKAKKEIIEYLDKHKERTVPVSEVKDNLLLDIKVVERVVREYNVLKDKGLIDWIKQVGASDTNNTQELYKVIMIAYCNITCLLPTQLIEQAEKESTLPFRQQSIRSHISKFKDYIRTELAKTSRVTYMAAISSFYTFHDIPLNKKLLKYEFKPVIQKENDISPVFEELIKKGMMLAGDTLTKLIIAVPYTSGLARADVLKIKVKDVKENLKDGVACLGFRRQKTNIDFYTFLSPFTTELAVSYIEQMKLQDNDYLICEKHGEQMDEKHYLYLFRKLAWMMELPDNSGYYNQFHSHNLRKMFYNTLLKVGGWQISDLAEYFMGHKIPSTRAAYFKADIESLRKEYLKFASYFDGGLKPAVIQQSHETPYSSTGHHETGSRSCETCSMHSF